MRTRKRTPKRHNMIVKVDYLEGWILACTCGWRLQLPEGELELAERIKTQHPEPQPIH